MTKATHNGTCQACGRSQAFNGSLAKHGYTTKWGYFAGTCSGSDKSPLELETSHNVATVAAIRDWADAQDAKAASDIKEVIVNVYVKGDYNKGTAGHRENQTMNRVQFIEYAKGFSGAQGNEAWEKQVAAFKLNLTRNAEFARKDADNLDALRDKTYGNELTPRQVESDLVRKYFNSPRDAYTMQADLKEQGIKATVRRSKYGEITLSYRK